MDFRNLKVLIVGDVMLDEYIQGSSDRVSPEAPVPIVLVNEKTSALGGAANVANNCASLGASVMLIGITGEDSAGKEISLALKTKNINYLGPIIKGVLTTKKVRILSRSQQLLRVDYEKNTKIHYKEILDIFKSVINKADIVIFSDYGKGSLNKINVLINEAKQYNKLIFIDPIGNDFSKYKHADYLKPNLKELKQVIGDWTNLDDLELKVFSLMKIHNIKNLILTQSEDGCVLFSLKKNKINKKYFSVEKREVYDVTGAGDAFVSVFALMIGNSIEINKAIEYANKGAGSVVDKLGTYSVKLKDLL